MNLFVDTSVWSLALRRDIATKTTAPEVEFLRLAIERGESVITTGLVIQELLQGLAGPKDRKHLIDSLAALPAVVPDRDDHIEAANLRNACRRRGVQIGTIDALLAEICIRRELRMLSTDRDFAQIARHTTLALALPAKG